MQYRDVFPRLEKCCSYPSAGEVLLTFWISGYNTKINTIRVPLYQTGLQVFKSKLTSKTEKYVRTLNWDTDAEGEKM